jgi:hypothetical protein
MSCPSSTKSSQNKAFKAGTCYRCGRDSHLASECYAKSSVDGHDLTPGAASRSTESRDSPPSRSQVVSLATIFSNPNMSGGKRKNCEQTDAILSRVIQRGGALERVSHFTRYSDGDSESEDSESSTDSDSFDSFYFLIAGKECPRYERMVKQRPDGEGRPGGSTKNSNAASKSKGTVYVLELAGGKYYVGKTRNLRKREAQHANGEGSAWTRAHRVLRALPASTPGNPDDLESWERAETLHLAHLHGIDNVRGHKYTAVELSAEDRQTFFGDICERKDLCRLCGRGSHMASECFATSKAEWARGC